jgi:uncharacterized protein YegL
VAKTKDEFEQRTGQSLEQLPNMDRPPQTNNVSEIISFIVWAKQLSLRVHSNSDIAKSLFPDIQQTSKLT